MSNVEKHCSGGKMNGRRRERIRLAMAVVESSRRSISVPTVDTWSRRRTREVAMLKVRG